MCWITDARHYIQFRNHMNALSIWILFVRSWAPFWSECARACRNDYRIEILLLFNGRISRCHPRPSYSPNLRHRFRVRIQRHILLVSNIDLYIFIWIYRRSLNLHRKCLFFVTIRRHFPLNAGVFLSVRSTICHRCLSLPRHGLK